LLIDGRIDGRIPSRLVLITMLLLIEDLSRRKLAALAFLSCLGTTREASDGSDH
jgi:hypothetical protein